MLGVPRARTALELLHLLQILRLGIAGICISSMLRGVALAEVKRSCMMVWPQSLKHLILVTE